MTKAFQLVDEDTKKVHRVLEYIPKYIKIPKVYYQE